VEDARLALSGLGGTIFAGLYVLLVDPDTDQDSKIRQLTEQSLRLLGVPVEEARALAVAPVPRRLPLSGRAISSSTSGRPIGWIPVVAAHPLPPVRHACG
jgi:hypothetical protein